MSALAPERSRPSCPGNVPDTEEEDSAVLVEVVEAMEATEGLKGSVFILSFPITIS